MPETSLRPRSPSNPEPDFRRAATAPANSSLMARWRHGLSIVNLRGNPDDLAFREGVEQALGVTLPIRPSTTVASTVMRLVWAGPDDWFVIGPTEEAAAIEARLRSALEANCPGQHFAVTDVSSGYTVLHLSGRPVRDVLAQGCPLDLHPRAFRPGYSAGSLFFKASIWLWQTDETPAYEIMVRSSFRGYVGLMLDRATQGCGLVCSP